MFKFAIKNILRYRSRSMLTLIVIAFSALASMTCVGMMEGVINHMIDGFVKYDTAHIRITTTEFKEKIRFQPMYANIKEVNSFKEELLRFPEIELVSPAFRFGGLIAQNDSTIPVTLIALDLDNNSYDLKSKIITGKISDKGIIMGITLAEKFNLKVGDSPLIASTTVDSGLNATKTPIIATSYFGVSQFDKHTVIMDLQTGEKLLRTPDTATEVFIILKNIKNTDMMVEKLKKLYPDYVIDSYKDQMGPLYNSIEMEKNILYLLAMIIMFLGSFVITNSLVASIYERMHEIGMLKAIGFTNGELTRMLFYEGIIYGIIGGGIGFTAGALLVYYLSQVGMDFSASIGDANIPIESIIYPKLTFISATASLLIAVIVPGIVSLIPARLMKKITPVEALTSRG